MTPKLLTSSPLAVLLSFAALLVPLTLLCAPPEPLLRNPIVVIAVTPDAVIVGQDDDPRHAPEIKMLSEPKDGEETRFLTSGVQPNPCSCYVIGDQDVFNAVKANQDPFAAIFRGFYAKRLLAAQLSLKDSPAATQEAVAWVASFVDLEREFDERVGGGGSITILRKGHPPDVIRMDKISSW